MWGNVFLKCLGQTVACARYVPTHPEQRYCTVCYCAGHYCSDLKVCLRHQSPQNWSVGHSRSSLSNPKVVRVAALRKVAGHTRAHKGARRELKMRAEQAGLVAVRLASWPRRSQCCSSLWPLRTGRAEREGMLGSCRYISIPTVFGGLSTHAFGSARKTTAFRTSS